MFGGPNTNYNLADQNMQFERGFAANAPKFSDFGSTRQDALAMIGKPANYSTTDNLRGDLAAYSGVSDPRWGGWANVQGGGNGAHSIGGVSAVNPQAGQANELDAFQRYEDQAYSAAMGRLEPQFDQQMARFEQDMASRGIPVGSEAYNSALAQIQQGQGDATQQAIFNAMGFGLGAQNQSFQQDYARSQLANALLQAQWQKELGWGNIGLGQQGLQLQQNRLNEDARQFDSNLGYQYDTFYDTLGQRAYEFDAGQDYDYWNQGNYWDFAYDRANMNDYFNAYDRDYGSQMDFMNLVMNMFGGSPGSAGLNPGYYPQQGSPYDWSWMFS